MKFKKRIAVTLLVIAVLSMVLSAVAFASEPTVTLRIEGINKNFYYSEVELGESKTVSELLMAVDAVEDSLSVTGAETGYVTAINGEAAATFGGWDGWMFRVNNTEPPVGMNEYEIKHGDEIVIYYSDAYGAGMQYPVMDASNIANGVIKFTSMDTTYDENYNPLVSENPVVGMIVLFDKKEFVTDEKGCVTISSDLLSLGDHSVSVSKYAENGAPLVLRLSPDAKVTVFESTSEGETPQTGDKKSVFAIALVLMLALACAVVTAKKRK